ncbi:MAG: hypothetical protein MZW92_46195 [Comamonadaceae bacterium]|nr:hypothetical protein [Comamonadaceae bacterium]
MAADVIIELDRPSGRPIVLIERQQSAARLGDSRRVRGCRREPSRRRRCARRARRPRCACALNALLGCIPIRPAIRAAIRPRWCTSAEAQGEPRAQDDAAGAGDVFSPDRLPATLAFDHPRILADYRAFRATGGAGAAAKSWMSATSRCG